MEDRKKRNRLTLSCNYCKKRKVKCDRAQPCSSCLKYNVGDLCDYTFTRRKGPKTIDHTGKLPAFSVNESMVDHTTPPYGVISELELLKGRIRELEHSIRPGNNSVRSPPVTPSFPTGTTTILGGTMGGGTHTTGSNIGSNTGSSLGGNNNGNNSDGTNFPPRADSITTPGFLFGTTGITPQPVESHPISLPRLNWSPPPVADTPRSLPEEIHSFKANSSNTNEYAKQRLKFLIGKNPCRDRDDVINYYTGHPSISKDSPIHDLSAGVFSWMAYVRKDPTLSQIYCYLNDGKREVFHANLIKRNTQEDGAKARTDADQLAEEGFRQKAMKNSGSMDTVLYTSLEEKVPPQAAGIQIVTSIAAVPDTNNSSQDTLALGLTVKKDALNVELELAERILTILPNRKVLWVLMSKFFLFVYPFVPFVDEATFRAEIARILGPEEHLESKIESLNVEKRLDFAYLGIMLIMLRFAYLFLFSNRPEVNEFNLNNTAETSQALTLRYLLSNPIAIQVVELAQLCLNKFDLMRMTELPVLQLLYALRFYHVHGPEEGDNVEGGTDQISNGLLVHVAYTQGVNREPEKFMDGENDEKLNNLLRKLWFFIMVSDLMQGHQFGNQVAINPDYFDTRLPFYKPGNENLLDTKLEQYTISIFRYFDKYGVPLRKLVNLGLNVKGSKLGEVVDVLSELESTLYDNFGSLADFMTPFVDDNFEYPFMKIMKCKMYISTNNFLLSNFVHLYFHFRQLGDVRMSLFYFRKSIVNSTLNMMPYYFDLFGLNHVNFGIGADVVINPSFITLIHKTTQMNLSMWALINTVIHSLKTSPTHSMDITSTRYQARFRRCCQLSKNLHTICKFGVLTMSRLSNRYYYAWRICKVYNFIVRFSSKNELYSHITHEEPLNYFNQISDDDLEDLCKIYDLTIHRITERKKIYDSAEPIMHFPPCKRPIFDSEEVVEDPQPVKIDGLNWWPYGSKESDDSTPTTNSDSAYLDLADNKDIDKFWVQLTGDIKNQELSVLDYDSVMDFSSGFDDFFKS